MFKLLILASLIALAYGSEKGLRSYQDEPEVYPEELKTLRGPGPTKKPSDAPAAQHDCTLSSDGTEFLCPDGRVYRLVLSHDQNGRGMTEKLEGKKKIDSVKVKKANQE